MNDPGSEIPIVFNNCISVNGAAFHSGYNVQYLRRLLREGRLTSVRLKPIWIILTKSTISGLDPSNILGDTIFSIDDVNVTSFLFTSSRETIRISLAELALSI